MKTQFGVGDG